MVHSRDFWKICSKQPCSLSHHSEPTSPQYHEVGTARFISVSSFSIMSLVLHTQNLNDVISQLVHWEPRDDWVKHVCNLARQNNLYALNENVLKTYRKKSASTIPTLPSDNPLLSGEEKLSSHPCPTVPQMQAYLLQDLEDHKTNSYLFFSSLDSPNQNYDAIKMLLENFEDPNSDTEGAIMQICSPIFKSLCKNSIPFVETDILDHTDNFTTMVGSSWRNL